jgi:hypothetical protein
MAPARKESVPSRGEFAPCWLTSFLRVAALPSPARASPEGVHSPDILGPRCIPVPNPSCTVWERGGGVWESLVGSETRGSEIFRGRHLLTGERGAGERGWWNLNEWQAKVGSHPLGMWIDARSGPGPMVSLKLGDGQSCLLREKSSISHRAISLQCCNVQWPAEYVTY